MTDDTDAARAELLAAAAAAPDLATRLRRLEDAAGLLADDEAQQ